MRGLPDGVSQQIESNFFQPVDTTASESLFLLEKGVPKKDWRDEHICGWARFIMSLLMRCPEDLAAFRLAWDRDFSTPLRGIQRDYEEIRAEDDTVRECLKNLPLSA